MSNTNNIERTLTLNETQYHQVCTLVSYLQYDCGEVKSFVESNYEFLEENDAADAWKKRNETDSPFYGTLAKDLLELDEALGGEKAVDVLYGLI